MNKKIFIGVAWPYVNGDLHIGHLAGYLLPADIFARYHRFADNDVLMVSGSDCFGTPITIEADKKGVSPSEIVNTYHPRNLELFKLLGLTFDLYTKTDTDNHKRITQEFFLALLKEGLISKDKSLQYYSEKEGKFLPDRYVEGTCPKCSYNPARSDQCDNCGSPLNQGELIDPVSKLTGSNVILKETEHYFVNWNQLQPKLEEYVAAKGGKWREWVLKDTKRWLKEGLKPRAITRDLDWGVEIPADRIPKDQLIENWQNKRIYVWFDAVIGYYSATEEWAQAHTQDVKKTYWLNDESIHHYFMGKDNLVFHTLFWPGQLMGYNKEFHLPDYPVINQFLTLDGQKFSKSRGIIVDSKEITEKYGTDVVRFYLTSILPENADSDFTWQDFEAKTNGVLIANIANYIFRSLKLAEKVDREGDYSVNHEFCDVIIQDLNKALKLIEACRFKEYLEAIVELSSKCNKFITVNEPWKLSKTDKKYLEVINTLVYSVIVLAILLKPILPNTVEKLEAQLGQRFDRLPTDLDDVKKYIEKAVINNPAPLFQKIEIDQHE